MVDGSVSVLHILSAQSTFHLWKRLDYLSESVCTCRITRSRRKLFCSSVMEIYFVFPGSLTPLILELL
jgi:hypothetical protein